MEFTTTSNTFNNPKLGDEQRAANYTTMANQGQYPPVPDSRFYTKANFFTLQKEGSENNTSMSISETYKQNKHRQEQQRERSP